MKKYEALSLTGVLLAFCLAGCEQPAPTAGDDADLAARGEAWAAMAAAGDLDGLVDLYAEDAMVFPPNAEAESGHDAIRESMRPFAEMSEQGIRIDLADRKAVSSGDLGYQTGRFSIASADGELLDRGKFIEIWRKVDGEWKISHDMYSSDLPPPGSGDEDLELLVATHEVEDRDRWLAAWSSPDGRHATFAEHGAPEVTVLTAEGDSPLVGLVIRVADMQAFQDFLASEAGTQAKAEDGVIDETITLLTPAQ